MLNTLTIIIKGAGEMASGIAWRLYRSGFHKIIMLETAKPMAIRRRVCFSEAVYDMNKTVDTITAELATNHQDAAAIMARGNIVVMIDPQWQQIGQIKPDIVIDAILAKKNLGTGLQEAPLVIGTGPGFTAGKDVHAVIETNRGPNLGRVIYEGSPEPNTGLPQQVMGFTTERVLYAGSTGIVKGAKPLGSQVVKGERIASIGTTEVTATLSGTLRGLIRNNSKVRAQTKIGDIEPRDQVNIDKVSDKALAIGGGVLETVLGRFNINYQ